jgi:hypothetical protein
MKSRFLHWLAILLILEIGLLHIMTAQTEYEEAAYMGYLFAANFFGALLAAFGMYHKQVWGWVFGAVIAAGSIAGYAWSRTLGMPGMNVEEWFTPYGVVSISMEVLFLLIFLLRPWKNFAVESLRFDNAFKYLMMVTGLAAIVSMSLFSYRWDQYVTQAYGHHVGSLDQVCSIPVTSLAKLEEEYGVQVSLVATSMMGSIVDVRVKIIDPDKAHTLLQNQVALLVNQQVLILAPHMHSHNVTRLKKGKIFSVFFPTQQIISKGTDVSLVFGPVRVEKVAVR